MSRKSFIGIIVFLLFSLQSINGCLEKPYELVESNIGLVKVRGDFDLVKILNCTVHSSIYNTSMGWPEKVEGFVYSNKTIYYSVSGFAENLMNYT